MKTMSPREFLFFLLGVAVFIAGCFYVGMHVSFPKVPVEALFFTTVIGSLWWLCAREMICVPLKQSFLVDKDNRVIAYHDTNRFVRTMVLKETGAKIVPHVFRAINRSRKIEISVGGVLVQVSISACTRVAKSHLQNYFDAFLSDKWLHSPESQLDDILADFLKAQSEWMRGGNWLVSTSADAIKNKLSDWLEEKLPIIGLKHVGVGCDISEVPYAIS